MKNKIEITHGSLFSGIDGFSLAAEWMGWQNMFQCEIDKYCIKLLNQNFPNTIKYGDIKTTDFTPWKNKITVLTGGFPCQPFSVSGKRNGTDDNRHLWPEMYRAIRQIEPPYIVAENVPGLLTIENGLPFEQVCTDLEAAGYEVQTFIVPACAHNAPHRRDRVWFVAHSARWWRGRLRNSEQTQRPCSSRETQSAGIHNTADVTHPHQPPAKHTVSAGRHLPASDGEFITDTNHQRQKQQPRNTQATNARQPGGRTGTNWLHFPTQPPVCRGNDGVPNRVDRIKGLGNAIVPQVVIPFFELIEWHISQPQ
jgi:DNA (cytosine-5)-methyltransferase 1